MWAVPVGLGGSPKEGYEFGRGILEGLDGKMEGRDDHILL